MNFVPSQNQGASIIVDASILPKKKKKQQRDLTDVVEEVKE